MPTSALIRAAAVLALVATTALCAPSLARAQSEAPAQACSTVRGKANLTGQSFAGPAVWKDGETFDFTLTFNADCSVRYGYRGEEWTSARWSQTARGVKIDFNGGFAIYTGTRRGKVLSGKMTNVRDETGTWRFVQQ